MKKILILLLLGINFIYANVGKITSLIGEVIIVRDNQEIIATKGMILELNDTIKTKNNSKALIHLKDETTINVGKKSNLNIKEFVVDEVNPANSKANINFGNGLFRTITGKIGKLNPKRFKIKTKTGSIGIRGTIFDVVVTDDITKIGVVDGGVFYIDEKTKSEFNIEVGQKLIYDDETQKIDVVDGNIEESDQLTIDDDQTTEEEKQEESKDKEEEKQEEESKDKEEKKIVEKAEKKAEEKVEEKTEEKLEKEEEKKIEEKIEKDLEKKPENENDENLDTSNTSQEDSQDETEDINTNDPVNKESSEENNDPINTSNSPEQDSEDTTDDLDTSNSVQEDTPDLVNQNVEDDVNTEQKDPNTAPIVQEIVNNNEEVEEFKEEETVNSSPVLAIERNNTTRENEIKKISYSASDPDNDEVTFRIDKTTQNGTLSLDTTNNELVYTPNNEYTGNDSFTVIVEDSKGATTEVEVTITVEVYNPTSDAPTSTSDTVSNLDNIAAITKEIVGSDNFMEFGFKFSEDSSGVRTTDVYSSGNLTPSLVIEQYINNNATGSYSGNVAAIITDANDNKTTVNNGQINLSFDFGNESFTGNVKINDDWNADINSGNIRSNQFTSSDISSNTNSNIQDITGNINGNFMGDQAQSVAGEINLNSTTSGSVKASFGASKGE